MLEGIDAVTEFGALMGGWRDPHSAMHYARPAARKRAIRVDRSALLMSPPAMSGGVASGPGGGNAAERADFAATADSAELFEASWTVTTLSK